VWLSADLVSYINRRPGQVKAAVRENGRPLGPGGSLHQARLRCV
jgi:hypothetical protein